MTDIFPLGLIFAELCIVMSFEEKIEARIYAPLPLHWSFAQKNQYIFADFQ